MSDKNNNKMYWIEGVSEKEVVAALNDTRWNALRTRPARRALVIGFSAAALALLVTAIDFGAGDVINGLLSGIVFIALGGMLFLGYFALRTSVRQLADAPDELLDERQIAVRNSVYLHAYRLSAAVMLCVLVVALFDILSWPNVLFTVAMLMAALPSMVLAWQLPDEN
ncbi:MAG: hypothetical protein RLZZ587_376 [Actinomycetota bacterium]